MLAVLKMQTVYACDLDGIRGLVIRLGIFGFSTDLIVGVDGVEKKSRFACHFSNTSFLYEIQQSLDGWSRIRICIVDLNKVKTT